MFKTWCHNLASGACQTSALLSLTVGPNQSSLSGVLMDAAANRRSFPCEPGPRTPRRRDLRSPAGPRAPPTEEDDLAPGATLQPTAAPEGAEEGAGERRRRGAPENTRDWHFPSPRAVSRKRALGETQGACGSPTGDPVRCNPSGEALARPPGPPSRARAVLAPPATPSAAPAPRRRSQCKH